MTEVLARTDWPIAGWRAWYADGSVYDSLRHDWLEIPPDGVLAVKIFYDRHTRGGVRYTHTLTAADWYWRWGRTGTTLDRGSWIPVPSHVPPEELKSGLWVSDLDYDIVMSKVGSSTWP